MDRKNEKIICICGFNCEWFLPNKNGTKILIDLARMFQINEPTRIIDRIRTQIDLAFSNRPKKIIKSAVYIILE